MNKHIRIRELKSGQRVSLPVKGFENLNQAYSRLINWATGIKLLEDPTHKVIKIYHDSAKDIAPEQVRMSAGIWLPKKVEIEKGMEIKDFIPGKCMVASLTIGIEEFEAAWNCLFLKMNELGYKRSGLDPFEVYHNNYRDHPEGKFILDLCIPIE